jgi:multidrug transporter EmrE-like cation transporter
VANLLVNPGVLSGVAATFFAGVSWMLAMTKFEISYAYPWMSLNFILVLLLGVMLFNETFTTAKVFGTLLVIAGVVVIARS